MFVGCYGDANGGALGAREVREGSVRHVYGRAQQGERPSPSGRVKDRGTEFGNEFGVRTPARLPGVIDAARGWVVLGGVGSGCVPSPRPGGLTT